MLKIENISYKELYDKNYLCFNDKYGLATFINETVRITLLNNPNNNCNEKTSIIFAIENGDIVGRHILYPTVIKCSSGIINAQSSGSTEVHQSQRGKGIGTRINQYTLNNDEYPLYICSLLSHSCLSIMRKKENGCTIFDFPQFIKIVNTEPAFASRGIKGFPLKILKLFGNLAIKILDIPNKIKIKKIKKNYIIRKESIVPQWAGNMCLDDGHKYAEYHDAQWLQWCLDYNLSGQKEDIQSFYTIFDKSNHPVGFFMTKERLLKNVGKYKTMLCGTICEWASIDENLSETDINLLALETFSRDCYHILTVTDSPSTAKTLRRIGFIKHGYMQMGFKDKLNQFPDMNDMNLWRIRFGCCNSILY